MHRPEADTTLQWKNMPSRKAFSNSLKKAVLWPLSACAGSPGLCGEVEKLSRVCWL